MVECQPKWNVQSPKHQLILESKRKQKHKQRQQLQRHQRTYPTKPKPKHLLCHSRNVPETFIVKLYIKKFIRALGRQVGNQESSNLLLHSKYLASQSSMDPVSNRIHTFKFIT